VTVLHARAAATRSSIPAVAPLMLASHSAAETSTPAAGPVRCDCHFCGSVLPRGRSLTFCPHCGQNLTVRQCPACSAEVEMVWKFCVCCGRGVGD